LLSGRADGCTQSKVTSASEEKRTFADRGIRQRKALHWATALLYWQHLAHDPDGSLQPASHINVKYGANAKSLSMSARGFSRNLRIKGQREQGAMVPCPFNILYAEPVKLSLACAAEKCMPFVRSEPKHWAGGVLGIADADPAIGQAGNLDTVAIGETQRTLDPG